MLGQILVILLYLVIAFLTLLLVVLCLPWRVRGCVASGAASEVEIRIAGLALKLPLGKRVQDHQQKRPKRHKKRKRKTRRPMSKAQGQKLLAGLPGLLRALRDKIEIEHLSMEGRLGLGDPALTGQAYGIISSLRWALFSSQDIQLAPDFDRAGFDGRVEGALRFVPIRILGTLVGFAWRVGLAR